MQACLPQKLLFQCFGWNNNTYPCSETAKFCAITTSYELDALSEDRIATGKYYACRKELDEFHGNPVRTYTLAESAKQGIKNVKFAKFEQYSSGIPSVSFEKAEITDGEFRDNVI